ncbi:MAG: CHAD domain-containing protein [Ktedonobacterales bacterium]
MEIESKFAVTGPVTPTMVGGLDLYPYQLDSAQVEQHEDQVLDTLSRELSRARQALRVRHVGDTAVLTLKGRNSGQGGVHAREELEAPLPPGADGDLERWPETISTRVVPLLHGAALLPLVHVSVERHTWKVMHDGQQVAEVALDNGDIAAGGRTLPIHELEIELKGDGSRVDLDALSRRFQDSLPLRAESLSKVQRGLALLDGRNPSGTTTLADAGRLAIGQQVAAIRRAEPVVRAGDDAEGVHDMRVAVRRVRTVLDVLCAAPDFDAKQLRKLRKRLKALARVLGAVRDLDVLIAHVAGYAAQQPDLASDLSVFEKMLSGRRERARPRLLDALDRQRVARALDALDALGSGDAVLCARGSRPGEPVTVAEFAGSALWARYERVLGFDDAVRERNPKRLHQLRIACKRLRYALELFAPQLGPGTDPLLKALKRAQDNLGTMHDAVVARGLVAQVAAKHAKASGLAVYAAALAAEKDERIEDFVPQWRQISGQEFRAPLAALIGAL